MELSIVMPCLNEAGTIQACIGKAHRFIQDANIEGEVVVADNGSTDGSQQLALAAGARVLDIPRQGYGNALLGGICAARGRFVIVGDADDSYDFAALAAFVDRLRAGYQLVMGNRFKGGILPHAMPSLHRYLGNPVLSFIGRVFFGVREVHDFHCGLRGFDREAVLKLGLSCPGMEFASEMIVKAAFAGLRMTEVPTILSPDRRGRRPHLRTWRDGWRHLRFLLLHSPRWLFLYPGIALLGLGVCGQVVLGAGQLKVGAVQLGVHSMLYSAAATVVGLQVIWLALFSKILAVRAGMLPPSKKLSRWLARFTIERGVVLGIALFAIGLVSSALATVNWGLTGFGGLDPTKVMRITIPAVSMMICGVEIIAASFFLGLIGVLPEESSKRPAEHPHADLPEGQSA